MQTLTKFALVGTAKQPAAAVAADGHPTDELSQRLPPDDVEGAFLLRSALQAVYGQAGKRAVTGVAAVEPAEREADRIGSRKLAGMLQHVFDTGATELLIEFLRPMEGSGIVIPYDLLPQALDCSDAAVRERLLPVLGARGNWLARQNDAWSWVTDGVSTLTKTNVELLKQTWEEGTFAERRQALETLRRSNPAEAREWLSSDMPREKADHRARLLAACELGLSPEDEPFLETCLDDRSLVVTRTAAGLLARIPASALSRRMRERADAMFTTESKGLLKKKLRLVSNPPEQIDKDWERDGIASKPPAGSGKRAHWTVTLLASIPPSHWTARFDVPADQLINAVEGDNFAGAILSGWTHAAAIFAADDVESATWLWPLWKEWSAAAEREKGKGRAEAIAHLSSLLPLLSLADAENALTGLLESSKKEAQGDLLGLLTEVDRPWSTAFAMKYLNVVRAVLKKQKDNSAYLWANTLSTAGSALPEEAFAAALADWQIAESDSTWHVEAARREVEKFCDTVQMRKSFLEELQTSASHATG